jgi:hypothetical protein
MKGLDLGTTFVLGLVFGAGTLAGAQDKQPASSLTGQAPLGESRIEVGLAFAQTLGTVSFNASQTFKEYVEDATFTSSYKVGSAPGAGLDLQYSLNRKFGIRLGAQTFSRKSDGTFNAQIPHPFFFSKPRSVSGTQSGLGFSETAFSLTGVIRGGSGKWKFSLEGGPAIFSVDATVAEKITYGEVYPYDAATFSGITSVKKKVSPFGFAVGVEVGRELSNAVTVVAQGRFTQGSGDLDLNGQKIGIKAGGAQARIGLRLVLARKKAGG